jgi:hypothetical protein
MDEASTCESREDAERFPTLVNLMLRHSGTMKFAENALCVVKGRAKEELPY